METNHFLVGQIKTLDVMKQLPDIVASKLAKEIEIEKDKIKNEGLKDVR